MGTCWPIRRREGLPWLVKLLFGCAVAVVPALVVTGLGAAAFSPAPIDWSDLFAATFDRNDLYLPLFLVAFLTIELVQNGWQKSALRRVLQAQDPSTRTDLVYCTATLTRLMPVIAAVLTLGLNRAIKEFEAAPGLRLFLDLPLWIAIPSVLLVQSFGGYWLHRLLHSPLLWPLHAVHHAATDFNVITALRHHPWDGVIAALILPLLPVLLGFPVEAITIVLLMASAYTIYVHTELPTSDFIERFIAFGPRGHGIHHSKDASCYNTNFGDLVIWDRLFRTYRVDVSAPLTYGCEDPNGIYQSDRPLRDMVAVQVACCRNLWSAVRGTERQSQPA